MSQQWRREAVSEPGCLDDLEHWTRTNQKLAVRTSKAAQESIGRLRSSSAERLAATSMALGNVYKTAFNGPRKVTVPTIWSSFV